MAAFLARPALWRAAGLRGAAGARAASTAATLDAGEHAQAFTHIARRRALEDRVVHARQPATGLDVYGVFDGHGGTFVAEYLAKHLMDKILTLRNPLLPEQLAYAFATVDRELTSTLRQLDEPWAAHVGSTALVTVVGPNEVTVANVGDSRALLCHRGETFQLSLDHRPHRASEARRIEMAGGVISWVGTPRVNGRLAMTRAFGALDVQSVGVTARPEISRHEITLDDHCLLLATDGVFDMMNNKLVGHVALSAHSIEEAADSIVEQALSRGSKDNLSGFVVPLTGWNSRPEFDLSALSHLNTGSWVPSTRH